MKTISRYIMTLALLITTATGAWAQGTTPEPGTVTINEAKTEATFTMPQSDVTATYTIKRDMTVDVTATIDARIRIKKDGNDYQPVGANGNIDESAALPTVTDALDNANTSMTKDTDYTLQLQKKTGTGENDWGNVNAYSVGTFRYKITGTGNYGGEIYTDNFTLFEGYKVVVPAGEYVTYYKDEALKVEDADAELYTITAVSGTTATLSDALNVVPAGTPILVKNKNTSEEKTIVLIPTTTDTPDNVTPYEGFTGTLEAKTTDNNDAYGPWNMAEGKKYYAFNGKEFVWVKTDLDIAANKAWLEVPVTASAAPQIRLIFSSTTGIESVDREQSTVDGWYDLNGRRLPGKPTKKGVYIVNGKKMVVK